MDLDVDVLEVGQRAADLVALHGEQADLGLHREAVGNFAGADLLEVPDDLVEREGDLLLGLEPHDVADLLLLDRRQLDEPRQAALAGDADGDEVALDVVAGEELLQRLAGELVRVGVGLAQDLRVLDVVEGGRRHGPVDHLQPQRLERRLTDVNPPDTVLHWHGLNSPEGPSCTVG